MRLSEVKSITGLSKTTIYRFEKEGRFPSRVSLGERSVGWFEDDIREFLYVTSKINSPLKALTLFLASGLGLFCMKFRSHSLASSVSKELRV